MDLYYFPLINGGGPLCTVQRLKAQCDEALSHLLSHSTCAATPRAALSRCHQTACCANPPPWRTCAFQASLNKAASGAAPSTPARERIRRRLI